MKIGIDARCLQERQGSGVAVFARGLLRAMFRLGGEHSFVLFANSFRGDASALTEFLSSNVTLRSFRIPNKLLHASEILLRRPALDRLMGDVDIVFMPNIHFASVSASIPLVVTFFDMSYKSHADLLSMRSRLWHRVVDPRRLAERASAVATISQHSKATISRYLAVPREKIHVVYPGVNTFRDASMFASEDASRQAGKYILILSDFDPRKNILSLLRAFETAQKTLPDRVRCVVVGRDGWNRRYAKTVRKMAARIPGVEFRGYVSETEKWGLLKNAAALVYVSYEEGFGFPPLEAMSVGTPALASCLASLPEALGDAALLVNPYDVAEITEGLGAILTDDALCARLRVRGFERIKNYSWDTAARQMIDLFMSLRPQNEGLKK